MSFEATSIHLPVIRSGILVLADAQEHAGGKCFRGDGLIVIHYIAKLGQLLTAYCRLMSDKRTQSAARVFIRPTLEGIIKMMAFHANPAAIYGSMCDELKNERRLLKRLGDLGAESFGQFSKNVDKHKKEMRGFLGATLGIAGQLPEGMDTAHLARLGSCDDIYIQFYAVYCGPIHVSGREVLAKRGDPGSFEDPELDLRICVLLLVKLLKFLEKGAVMKQDGTSHELLSRTKNWDDFWQGVNNLPPMTQLAFFAPKPESSGGCNTRNTH